MGDTMTDRQYLAWRKKLENHKSNERVSVRKAVESGRAMLLSSRPANWESYYRKGN